MKSSTLPDIAQFRTDSDKSERIISQVNLIVNFFWTKRKKSLCIKINM